MNIMPPTRTIAPDSDLKNMPFQQGTIDVARLPNWNYSTGTPWSRDNIPAISRGLFASPTWQNLCGTSVIFHPEDLSMTYLNPFAYAGTVITQRAFFTISDYYATQDNYAFVFNKYPYQPVFPTPDGTTTKPWPGTNTPGAGQLSLSGLYNYAFTWTNPTWVPIVAAPFFDTTGWAKGITPPTQETTSLKRNYTVASAISLNAFVASFNRIILDVGVSLPTNPSKLTTAIPVGTSSISVRIGNCASLTVGNTITIQADKPISPGSVQRGWKVERFNITYGRGLIYLTSIAIMDSSDAFFIVIDGYNNLSSLTFSRSATSPA